MRIGLINVPNETVFSMNKDLVGGLGQMWRVGNSIFSKIISNLQKKYVKLPLLSLAYAQAIIRSLGHEVDYNETIPERECDIFFIYGSMIDYENENNFAKKIKEKFPNSKVGFIGPFPTKFPELFKGDFSIIGEIEAFFLYSFLEDKKKYFGRIIVKKDMKMDDLPTPDFEGFPIKSYGYFPALNKKPVLTLKASHGCPYSCSYYCAYGHYQKSIYKKRSPIKIFEDIKELIKKYKIRSIQFRDATFGIDKKQVEELCELIIKNKVKINWGIETRVDLLNEKMIKQMFDAGLRNINIGIETFDKNIAVANKRIISEVSHQERIISYCKKIGVKISAFYIFGYGGDTTDSIKRLIDYSIKLNTNAVRFAISTPFPGTPFFDKLKKEKKIKSFDFRRYNSFELIFEHDNLSPKQLEILKELAFKKYYFRIKYMIEFLKWKIREFWL